MKIYLKKSAWGQLTLIFTLARFAFSPAALAVTPADGDYRNQNTAKDALFRFTAGIDIIQRKIVWCWQHALSLHVANLQTQ